MTDALAAEAAPETTPAATPPVLTEAQIEELIQKKTDQRISGLQSLYDRKYRELSDQLKKAERALAGTEDDPRESDIAAELRRQERENKMLRVALEHPELAPVITKFDPDASPEDIAAALLEYRQSFTPTAPPTPSTPEAPVVPDVEANRPRRDPSGWEEGQPMTEELAKMILGG